MLKYKNVKPTFYKLAIGTLVHSLGLNKFNEDIIQLKQIKDYLLIQKIQKDNGYMDFSVGIYSKNGRKFFIKTLNAQQNDYRHFFLISEWRLSNALYETLTKFKSKIRTPKPVEIIITDRYASLVYQAIDGKLLSQYELNYQATVFLHIFKELEKITSSLRSSQIKLIPRRSLLFYFVSLPYISLMTFFRTGRNFKIIAKAFFNTLSMLPSQKINGKLTLMHRDLKPHNIIIKDSKIFLTDTGRMVLTLPGYDLAFLSLDQAYTDLTESLRKSLNMPVNKCLRSYIALQFADSSARVGMGKNYWAFLKANYGLKSKNEFSKPNGYGLSLMFSKAKLASRYLRHLLFNNFYHLGKRVSFGESVVIDNAQSISLGDRVYLEKNVTLKFLEEFAAAGFKKPNLKIDEGVSVSAGTIIAAAKFIHIKKNAMIGPYCFIGDHDHEYRNTAVPIRYQGYVNVDDIVIEEGAWIGAHTTICSGVTIGKNSVVGANSLVLNDIPPFSLAVGSPAKVVKRFNARTKKWEAVK